MSGHLDIIALVKALRQIGRAMEIHSRRIDRECGLTLPQYIVLTCVRDLGEVTSRAISDTADLSPATVAGILEKLERKGFIERYRSRQDRRIVHTRLTDGGTEVLANAPSPVGRALEQSLLDMDAAERATIVVAMTKIATAALSEPKSQPIRLSLQAVRTL